MTGNTLPKKRLVSVRACPPPHPKAHWLVHFLYAQMRIEGMSRSDLGKAAGIDDGTLYYWWNPEIRPEKRRGKIGIQLLEAALGVFDYDLKPTPRKSK